MKKSELPQEIREHFVVLYEYEDDKGEGEVVALLPKGVPVYRQLRIISHALSSEAADEKKEATKLHVYRAAGFMDRAADELEKIQK